MDWIVSDETFNATPPGSALVFELHHNSASNTDAVQVFFIAQTLDQIRNLTPLTGSEKPSIAPVYVPGCSGPAPGMRMFGGRVCAGSKRGRAGEVGLKSDGDLPTKPFSDGSFEVARRLP